MSEHDPIKATQEQLAGMGDIMSTMRQRERAAEEAMSNAENELNAIRKLRGYAEIEIERLRKRLEQLEDNKKGETT